VTRARAGAGAGEAVRLRQVFYIPGYDPFPPRRYRELYRTEGARQAQISGYELKLSAKGGNRWQVAYDDGGEAVISDAEVLVWSDIVQASMGQGIGATYLQLWRTSAPYIRSGALFRLMRLRAGPMIAALYPVAVLFAQLIVALAAGSTILLGSRGVVGGWTGLMVGLPLAVVAVWGLLSVFRRLDRHVYAWYLMHDYAFTAAHGGANPPALDRRLEEFSASLRAALASDVDEVLVVGHSSGAHLAVSVLADVLRGGDTSPGPELSLLTLGQVVPMVSFLPRAARLRGDLAYLAQSDRLTWVDVTAPGDGCAFALCDPVAVTGVAPPGKRWPLVLSAAFSQTLSPELWQKLRRRYFRLHFQYLCAFDRPAGYDYFAITAGPLTLGQRFAGRAPSKSRIERPLSRYRSLA